MQGRVGRRDRCAGKDRLKQTREREPIVYVSQRPPRVRALTETVHLNTCTQHTLKYTHTQRVCWWAEGVGEGLGGWYKASLKYKHRANHL